MAGVSPYGRWARDCYGFGSTDVGAVPPAREGCSGKTGRGVRPVVRGRSAAVATPASKQPALPLLRLRSTRSGIRHDLHPWQAASVRCGRAWIGGAFAGRSAGRRSVARDSDPLSRRDDRYICRHARSRARHSVHRHKPGCGARDGGRHRSLVQGIGSRGLPGRCASLRVTALRSASLAAELLRSDRPFRHRACRDQDLYRGKSRTMAGSDGDGTGSPRGGLTPCVCIGQVPGRPGSVPTNGSPYEW